MSIQWYPGHMTKARKVLDEAMPLHDLVVEVLDARMPRASDNPLVDEVRRHKPCLKVLAKSDLADPAVTEAWLAHLSRREVLALAITSERRADTRRPCPSSAGSSSPTGRARPCARSSSACPTWASPP
jgi:ribosome biogenesis GTPase A